MKDWTSAMRHALRRAGDNVADVDWSTVDVDWSTVDLTPSACVVRGYHYLRTAYPITLHYVDVERLDMGSDRWGVLAQLHGSHGVSLEEERESTEWLIAHGFTVFGMRADNVGETYRELTELWRAVLTMWQAES